MKNICLMIVTLALLSSCGNMMQGKSNIPGYTKFFGQKRDMNKLETRRIFLRGIPDGDDSYSTGFRNGCDTFAAVTGEGLVRTVPEKIDPERLLSDQQYLRGFEDGKEHCTYFFDWDVN